MFLPLAAFCAIATLGVQGKSPGALQQGVAWMEGAWSSAQKQGKPAAEKLIRNFPDRFKSIPKQIRELNKKYARSIGEVKLEERKAMLQELWRVRQSVNLMALLDSGVLEQITGIDSKMLKSAQQQVATLTRQLTGKKTPT